MSGRAGTRGALYTQMPTRCGVLLVACMHACIVLWPSMLNSLKVSTGALLGSTQPLKLQLEFASSVTTRDHPLTNLPYIMHALLLLHALHNDMDSKILPSSAHSDNYDTRME